MVHGVFVGFAFASQRITPIILQFPVAIALARWRDDAVSAPLSSKLDWSTIDSVVYLDGGTAVSGLRGMLHEAIAQY